MATFDNAAGLFGVLSLSDRPLSQVQTTERRPPRLPLLSLPRKLFFWENVEMKTTIELPDELVTEIKIEAARRRLKLKELVPELVRAGMRATREPAAGGRVAAERWLAEWVRMGAEATLDLPPGPPAGELVAAGRGRLERG